MTKMDKTYAELKAELDELLELLQSEDIDVDEAVERYQRGTELVKLLEAKLKQAKNKVTKLKVNFDQKL